MEATATCDGCSESFPKDKLFVGRDRAFWCDECRPKPFHPILLNFQLTWSEALALEEYIDGKRDLNTLEIIEEVHESLKFDIMELLRRVLRKDGIQESDS